MNIDAHQHFWLYSPEEYDWISDDMRILQRDFIPNDLEPLLNRANMGGSIAVQARQSLVETSWLLKQSDHHRFIKGVVGWVDLRSPDVEAQLNIFIEHPKFVGVRHVVHDEPDDNFILQPDFLRGMSCLAPLNLTYDILIFEKHLPVTLEFVKQFPEQSFVVDHIAKPSIKTGTLSDWAPRLKKLAAFPNVYCKLSGMVTEADWKHWTTEQLHPYMDVALEAFGPERLLFGSDWPVCTLAGSYLEVTNVVLEFISRLSKDEQRAILGENAITFYNIQRET